MRGEPEEWLRAQELAGLPGMPATHSAVVRRAKRDGWESRRRAGRGGGREYSFASLPVETRSAVLLRKPALASDEPSSPSESTPREPFTYDLETLWDWAQTRTQDLRDRASYKASIMREVVAQRRAGLSMRDAIKAVAHKHELKAGTVRGWWYGSNGQPGAKDYNPADWDAALIERYVGRTSTADCSPMAWDFMLKTYLTRRQYDFAKAYRRTEEAAAAHGWALPSARTLLRRLHSGEVPREVIELRRKGPEALRDTIPPLRRDPRCFTAGEAVTADGLKLDKLWVDFGDETLNTATVWVWQCIGTGRMLAPRLGKTENTDLIRLSAYDLLSICLPLYVQLDNTRAAANKPMTGGIERHRFKNRPDDYDGALIQLGMDVHFTDPNHDVTTPGVKPVERAFRDLHDEIANHPRFHGRGYSQATAVMADEVAEVVKEEIARHNARPNRRSLVCGGMKSFDQAWAESVERNPLRVAPEAQRRMLLLMPEAVHANRRDGHLQLKAGSGPRGKPRYFGPSVARYAGIKVVAYYDPDDLQKPLHVYTLDGRYIGTADRLPDTAWNDTDAAREHSKFKRRHLKATKQASDALDRMSALEYQELYPRTEQPPEPDPKIIKPGRWGRSGRKEIDGELSSVETEEVHKHASGSDISAADKHRFDDTMAEHFKAWRREQI